jgi:hypothetical protein
VELEEAIAFIDDLLAEKTQQGFNDVERLVFEGSWLGRTYKDISLQYNYSMGYLQRDVAPKLWSRLAKALGDDIGKKNIRTAIDRHRRNRVRYEVVLRIPNKPNESQLQQIKMSLRQQGQDPELIIREVKEGSVILVLEGSQEGFDRLSELFKTGQLSEILGIPVEDVRLQSATAPINWRQWLQNLRDELFEPYWQPPQLVLAGGYHKSAMSPYEIEEIAPLIQRLQSTNDEITRRQIATELGDIGVNSPEAIAALTDLFATSEDSETLWQAALSLGKINPSHPQAGIEMAKAIDLVSETQSFTVALLIAFRPKNEQKVSIRIRIEAIDEDNDLPNNLQVIVFDQSGDVFRQAQPTNPNFLELQGFSGSLGEQFSIRLSLGEASITENFVI